jgi:hypothetical protein
MLSGKRHLRTRVAEAALATARMQRVDAQFACLSTTTKGSFELLWHAVSQPARASAVVAQSWPLNRFVCSARTGLDPRWPLANIRRQSPTASLRPPHSGRHKGRADLLLRPRDSCYFVFRRGRGPRDLEDGRTVWFSPLDFLDKVAPEWAIQGGYSGNSRNRRPRMDGERGSINGFLGALTNAAALRT